MARASAAPSDAVPDGLSDGDWSSIRAAYEAGRHRVIAAEDGLEARNPGQQWTTRFDGRGFCTTPDASGWTFGLELVRYGWGDAEGAVEKARAVSADGGRVAYEWDDRLTEWYVNDSRGLEHGYTVGARPAAASGPLTLTLAVRGKLVAEIAAGGRDVRFVDATGALVLSYAGLTVFDADGRALVAGFETLDGRLKLTVEDLGARYPLTIDPVVQQAYLKASNTDPLDLFGEAIAVSGDTVVVGAPWEDSNATGVNGNQSDNSRFDSGAAYVFVRSGTSWSQQAYLKASDTSAADYFGGSVAISGDTLVVGAAGEDSNATGVDGNQNDYSKYDSGAAYVFVRSGTSWSQQAYLKASNTGVGDHFGDKVAVSGDTVVVGAHAESSNATGVNGNQSDDSMPASGATYVFVRSGTSWSQQAYLKASNTDAVDLFGSAVAVSGDTIVVGAWLEASNATGVNGNQSDNSMSYSGAAYVFVRSGTSWSQQAYLKASNTNGDDYFGVAVAVSGDTVVVGATGEDSNAVGVNGNQNDNSMASSGAAYVFVRSGTSWSQQAYLKASNTDASDNFGGVAVSGDTIVVGAPWEDSNATGVNGNQSDNSRSNSGAAYVFVRNGTSWSQQAYLKASNGGAGDLFGSVALSGGTVVVAADAEDSTATGVNGNQRSNGKRDSGAAYVFELDEAGGRGMGSFATYGTGTPGTGGLVPSIELVGSPNIGADIWLVIRDGLGGAPAIVLIGPGRDNVSYAGGALLVAVSAILTPTLGGPPGVAGAGTLRITDAIPDDPALSGVFVDFQVLVTDAAAVQGVALSNGAELKIGG
ncbi:MAG: FG-GAP repeat protein [Planctomycetes bacterium]|nr:FG-GAP repeat protein [Planctomycetota bacterium]